ncbi:heme biosynthesis protein HemY [Methylocystis sp.]|uniref:heme biosynthesis protein HemY n=1 Tax=Methylocystis sp. TaxID=1911079 RepID=UPI0027361FAF|nr:heme biosynthesis HemY N-terminal domain-containing protein [Methylocystis sp.]MDP3554615.1 heme biosynthesis HemY N-terminal domain-containing protein [Methylocystis sp.]
MLFLFFFIIALAAVAYGLELLIEQPGSLTLDFAGYQFEASIPVAVAGLLLIIAATVVLWAIAMAVLRLPGRWSGGSRTKRRDKGFDALSQGFIAVGSGDAARARKAAHVAERLLPSEPLTQVLKAQAAQLAGDRRVAEETFHKMTLKPETKLLGLRGLHIEARRRDDADAAHHFAKEAHDIAPVPWAGAAMLEHLASQGDWQKAREAIEASLTAKAIDAPTAQNLRAVIETAMAMEKERDHPHDALHLARQALKRRPGFAPAAVAAARVLARHGDQKQSLKLIETVWATKPHPDLAAAYLEALSGESNTTKLARVERLARAAPNAPESRHIVAEVALSARDFAKARAALAPLLAAENHPTAHTCLMMAEIEDGEHGPSGPVREWLARGSRAPRDPVWIADGVVSKNWLPMSPVTGRLDAFEWKPPPDSAQHLTEEGKPNIPAAFLTRPAEPVALPATEVSGAAGQQA